MKYDNLTIIVRSVGERTTDKCIEYLKRQFETDRIFVIKNVTPFSETIRRTFKIAIKENKYWTLVIDADIFLFEDRIDDFFKNAEHIVKENPNTLAIMPEVYDRFFEMSRGAGVHLYVSKNMKGLFHHINPESMRAESYAIKRMIDEGYDSYFLHQTVGIHDFFQSYEGIMMKGLLHCKKHSGIDHLIEKWKSKTDIPDFYWMYKAAALYKKIPHNDQVNDSNWARECVNKYVSEFPKQKELTDSEIECVLEECQYFASYTVVEGYKKEGFGYRKKLCSIVHGLVNRLKNRY